MQQYRTMRIVTRIVTLILGFILCTHIFLAQGDEKTPLEKNGLPKSYPIHGSDLLWKNELEVRQYLKAHPDALQRTSLQKTTAYSVGSTKAWYADNYITGSTSDRYQVPSTCRGVGTNCYVFVEDANWGTKVTQKMVDSIRIYFDSKTPANASKGIYQTDVETFGNPPDVDGDPKIVILLLDIKDGYDGSGGYVAGYFYSFNEVSNSKPGYSTSNNAEIFFIDISPANLSTADGLNEAISTLAHEFQHMIHFNYDQHENTFVNEGCSVLAEVNCGFPIYSQSYYASEPNHYLLDWRRDDNTAVLKDYSRAARFFVYMRDQVGIGLFKPLVASILTGTFGIDAGLQSISAGVHFSDLLKNWFVANILNDRTVDTKYGYNYPNLPQSSAKTLYNPNVALTTDTVNNYAVRYISFKKGSQLKATFTVSSPDLVIKAVEIGASSKRVLDVTSGAEFFEPLYGSTYTEVDFAVMNMNPSSPYTFTYRASGVNQAIELQNDYTEPTGVYPLAANDTVCVTFGAVQDGRLDSIRVALRRTSTIRSGIWKYTGTTRPSPLGQPLALNLSATGIVQPPSPYPVPWPNWVTIDLRSKNISTNSPFAVGFIMDGPYSGTTNNYVMATNGAYGNGPTSFTYSSGSSSGANWYYYTVNDAGDSVAVYLIRAYVSFATTGVRTTVELNPTTFNLDQNYPNPFNPSTVIRFHLPSRSFVNLKVYDMTGREVSTLVDGIKEAGIHEIKFDASHMPSGNYFYRMVTDKFVETKKLVLIK